MGNLFSSWILTASSIFSNGLTDIFSPEAIVVNTENPTESPTSNPSSNHPTFVPSFTPTFRPTFKPTAAPTFVPTSVPTLRPTLRPSGVPSASANPSSPTFSPTVTTWRLLGNDIQGANPMDEDGWAMSVSSDGLTVVLGSSANDYVRVFNYNMTTTQWEQKGHAIQGVFSNSNFGYSVAASADGLTVAVGATVGLNANGMLSVYRWNETHWMPVGQIIEGESMGDQLGFSITLNAAGNVLAAGGVYNEGLDLDAGHVRVYRYAFFLGVWVQVGQDLDGQGRGDFYGRSVRLSDDGLTLAVGAHRHDGGFTDAGHVQVFTFQGGRWVQLGNDIYGVAPGDRAGYAIDMTADGRTVIVGSYANDGSGLTAGHARVFTYVEALGDWTQLGQDLEGENALDEFAKAVAMTPDGRTIAVGGRYNDDAGLDAGHVRVFDFNVATGLWEQVGPDLDGAAAEDRFGNEQGVALSDDGRIVAVAALRHDGNGRPNTGNVQVFARL